MGAVGAGGRRRTDRYRRSSAGTRRAGSSGRWRSPCWRRTGRGRASCRTAAAGGRLSRSVGELTVLAGCAHRRRPAGFLASSARKRRVCSARFRRRTRSTVRSAAARRVVRVVLMIAIVQVTSCAPTAVIPSSRARSPPAALPSRPSGPSGAGRCCRGGRAAAACGRTRRRTLRSSE